MQMGVDVSGGFRDVALEPAEAAALVAVSPHRPPVAAKLGWELAVRLEEPPRTNDNQPLTWLMIDPETGFAPIVPWQNRPGAGTVVRVDGGLYARVSRAHARTFVYTRQTKPRVPHLV